MWDVNIIGENEKHRSADYFESQCSNDYMITWQLHKQIKILIDYDDLMD